VLAILNSIDVIVFVSKEFGVLDPKVMEIHCEQNVKAEPRFLFCLPLR
jgi:hypothetical protein